MRLIDNVAVRLSMALLPAITLWAMIFYFVMVDEINDEADDLLEVYAEQLMVKKLSGAPMPVANMLADKHYSISPVTETYADTHSWMEYYDADYHIDETNENEPARFLRTIFKDSSGDTFELTVCTPTFEKDDLTKTILWWILTLYIILLLTVIFIALAVLQKSMRPFYKILDWLNGYTPGKSHGTLSVSTNVKEFAELEKVAVELSERSDEVYEKQKQFIGNASHELQTPLAVLGGRIDWMLDNETLNESATGELIQMRRSINHIARLNKTLLLLTKIDNGQFPEISNVNINELIEDQINMLTEIFEGKGILCNISAPSVPVIAKMNETLANILITNLLKNAFVHSPQNGKLNVMLLDEKHPTATNADSEYAAGTKRQTATNADSEHTAVTKHSEPAVADAENCLEDNSTSKSGTKHSGMAVADKRSDNRMFEFGHTRAELNNRKSDRSSRTELNGAVLIVENTGAMPLNADKIFERFYQGSKKEGSTGLGLAMAKTIADRYGMNLSYSYIDGMHRFTLEFGSTR